jgi:hypothetical protein
VGLSEIGEWPYSGLSMVWFEFEELLDGHVAVSEVMM